MPEERIPIVINPRIEDLQSGKVKNPKIISVTTTTFGGVGEDRQVRYHTRWAPQYSGPSKGETFYVDGEYDSGMRVEIMMPWVVPKPHKLKASEAAGIIFNKSPYRFLRMYGSRDSDSYEMVHVAVARDGEGDIIHQVFSDPEDSELWTLLTKLIDEEDISIIGIYSVRPKLYSGKHYLAVGKDSDGRPIHRLYDSPESAKRPSRWSFDVEEVYHVDPFEDAIPRNPQIPTRIFEIARKNSMFERYRLYLLLEDVARGRTAEKLLKGFSPKWIEKAWHAHAGEEEKPPSI